MTRQLGLYDVWEKLHGNNIQVTYHHLNAASRIDRIYVNTASTDKLKMAVTDRVRRSSSNILHKWTYIVKPAIQQFFKFQGIQRAHTARNKLHYHYHLLQNIYQQQCDGKDVFKHMQAAKRRLNPLQERVFQGALTRSTKSSVIAEEKAALFLFLQKKNKGQTKLIHQLKTPDNQNITGTPLILEEAFKYFQSRFRHRGHSERAQHNVLQYLQRAISLDDQQLIEQPITEEEIRRAIFSASSKSAPGPDEITYNFYKAYWDFVKEQLLQVFNEVFKCQLDCTSFTEGIVILIPKKQCTGMIKDYRPITLLNADYKILMKIFENRLKTLLPQFIDIGQTCAVPGRKITNILSTIWDLVLKKRR
ncbi:hypothetical protein ANN_19153 [Periplaneta americana]|uniref:Reverse transcriptase domain-containing protein n=1 Tax=Periplaneta americana TaxID=6978 RepID=A0ABQ8S9S1_PERAM|nr:hypothetical protein ANN_19153 [Periplaneta americana]